MKQVHWTALGLMAASFVAGAAAALIIHIGFGGLAKVGVPYLVDNTFPILNFVGILLLVVGLQYLRNDLESARSAATAERAKMQTYFDARLTEIKADLDEIKKASDGQP